MRIRRSRLTADFVQVPNQAARDERLGYMARGVLVELLSRPDGWEATADDLWRRAQEERGPSSESRRDLRAAFAELKAAGYLVASRERLASGRFGTVLTLYDVPAAHTDVPASGTSARTGETNVSAGRTDVPACGTSVPPADVPACGTSEPPGETSVFPGRTDVPPGGILVRPAETPISPGRTDVPHAGTSNKKTGLENREENSLSAPAQQIMRAVEATADEAREMIRILETDNPKIETLSAYLARMAGNGTLALLRDRVRAGERAAVPRETPIPPPASAVLAQRRTSAAPPEERDEELTDREKAIAHARGRVGHSTPKARLVVPEQAEPAEVAEARAGLARHGDFGRWMDAAYGKLGPDAHRDEVVILANQLAQAHRTPAKEKA